MRISTRARQSSVKNQYDRPKCVAFAATALHEYTRRTLSMPGPTSEIDLSEEFLHYHCKKRDNLSLNSLGTTVTAAAASLAVEGQATEELCPYKPYSSSPHSTRPTKLALADGRLRLLPGLRRLPQTLESIEGSLRSDRPVIAVVDWYSNAYLAPSGRIGLPRPDDRFLGRHAVLIVELEDESQAGRPTIVFKNSWGPRWGDHGFGCFGEDYFVAHGLQIWGF
jgi:C1A family cysteine protease